MKIYKSPIDALIAQYINDVVTAEENAVMSAVLKCGINVDKDELVKALAYDRGQYAKGYADAKAELIRCKDCKYYDGHYCHNNLWGDGYGDYTSPIKKDDGYCDWAEREG